MRYGTIVYEVRDALGLSNTEYLLVDAVLKLQTTSVDHPGWCEAGASYLMWVLGCDRRTFFRNQERLVEKGIIEVVAGFGLRRVPQVIAAQMLTHIRNGSGEMPLSASSGEMPPVVVAKRPKGSGKMPLNNTTILQLYKGTSGAKKNQKKNSFQGVEQKSPPVPAPPPARRPRIPFKDSGLADIGVFRMNFPDEKPDVVKYYFDRAQKWSGSCTDWVRSIKKWISEDKAAGSGIFSQQQQPKNEPQTGHELSPGRGITSDKLDPEQLERLTRAAIERRRR